jgi:hypothetical protein
MPGEQDTGTGTSSEGFYVEGIFELEFLAIGLMNCH